MKKDNLVLTESGLMTEPKSQSIWFAYTKPREIARWFRRSVLSADTTPLRFELSRVSLVAYVTARIEGFPGDMAEQNVKKALEIAVVEWSRKSHEISQNEDDAVRYLLFLVLLAARFPVRALLPKFKTWLVNRTFEKPRLEENELHLALLRAVLAFGADRGVLGLCRQSIYDPRYASYCYRALWSHNPDDAINYFSDIAELNRKFGDRVVAFPSFFAEISRTFDNNNLASRLEKKLKKHKDIDLRLHVQKVLAGFNWSVQYHVGRVIVLPPPGKGEPVRDPKIIPLHKVDPEEENQYLRFLPKLFRSENIQLIYWNISEAS